jgi:hypothetical protein
MNAASKTLMQTEWAMLQDLNLSDDKAAHRCLPAVYRY